jgi:beta-galactosidase
MGLHEVMGCRETAVQTGDKGRTELKWISNEIVGLKPGDVIQARWYEETLEPLTPQAHVVAVLPGGGAAAIVSSFGQGRTLMLGSYVGAAYESRRDPVTVRFYNALLEWAGVESPVRVTGADPEVRYLESGDDVLVFAFNYSKQSMEPEIALHLNESAYRGVNLVTGEPVAVVSDAGSVRLRALIGPEDVWIVRLSPR